MLKTWRFSRGSCCPAKPGITRRNGITPRLRIIFRAGLLAVMLSYSMSAPVLAGPSSDGTIGASALSDWKLSGPGRISNETAPMISQDKLHDASQVAGAGLRLLDPQAAGGDATGGFFADMERWTDIFLADYLSFLPLIAMFAVAGAAALTYVIRRRLPLAGARPRPVAARGPDRSFAPPGSPLGVPLGAPMGATLPRAAFPQAVREGARATPQPRGPDRSRIKPGPVPPKRR